MQSGTGRVAVIVGEDDYLVAQAAAGIIGDGTGLEVIDSRTSTNAELQLADLRAADDSFSTPPFLEPRRVTWWKNVGFLPQSGKGGPAEDVKAALEKFARKIAAMPLPENQAFILSGPRLLATSIFAKTLKGAAEFVIFATGRPQDQRRAALGRVQDLAREMNLQFEPRADEAFVDRVGFDTRSLVSELGKLRDYLGPARHTVARADVEEISLPGAGVEPEIWAITDAIGERNLAKAIAACRRFELESGFAVLVTTVVEKFFRQLEEICDARAKGCEQKALEGMNPWAARRMAAHLANWKLGELRAARHRFMKLRERAVSTAGDADVLVLTELVRTLRRPSDS